MLEYIRLEKQACETAMITLRDALLRAKIAPDFAWQDRSKELKQEKKETDAKLAGMRKKHQGLRPHGVDTIQAQARELAIELGALNQAMAELQISIAKDKSHADELRSLSFRHKRATTARAVLSGVEFQSCPRCTQTLPQRPTEVCTVCGQIDLPEKASSDSARLDRDVQDRLADIEELVKRQGEELARLDREEHEVASRKRQLDERYAQLLTEYDSTFLTSAQELQRAEGRIEEELHTVQRLGRLLEELAELEGRVGKYKDEEADLVPKLRDARKIAESDLKNVQLLRELFLDCLMRAQLSGFSRDDQVELSPVDFQPVISSLREVATSSFANMGSGGKKTLFKCCFALAVHRVNARIKGPLPTFMVIDSAMKNISERANQLQFESFHTLLYELAATELAGVQFILIDKESIAPPAGFMRTYQERTMNPGDIANPPLVPYYSMPTPETDGPTQTLQID